LHNSVSVLNVMAPYIFKIVKMANIILGIFYHNEKNQVVFGHSDTEF